MQFGVSSLLRPISFHEEVLSLRFDFAALPSLRLFFLMTEQISSFFFCVVVEPLPSWALSLLLGWVERRVLSLPARIILSLAIQILPYRGVLLATFKAPISQVKTFFLFLLLAGSGLASPFLTERILPGSLIAPFRGLRLQPDLKGSSFFLPSSSLRRRKTSRVFSSFCLIPRPLRVLFLSSPVLFVFFSALYPHVLPHGPL